MWQWTHQFFGFAATMFRLIKRLLDTLDQEREIAIPEAAINTLLATLTAKSERFKTITVTLNDGWLDLDLIARHEGMEIGAGVSFSIEAATINRHEQVLRLFQREPSVVVGRHFPNAWQKWKVALMVWACRHVLRKDPLQYVIRNVDGLSIVDNHYTIDLGPYVHQKPAVAAAVYTMDVRRISVRKGHLYLLGAANLKSIEVLKDAYSYIATAVKKSDEAAPAPSPAAVEQAAHTEVRDGVIEIDPLSVKVSDIPPPTRPEDQHDTGTRH